MGSGADGMKALVTGGGGCLGTAIIDRLLARGDQVRSLARGDYPGLHAKGVEVLRGDLADLPTVLHAVRGVDLVFHVAAKAGVWGPYEDYYRANVLGTKNILEACKTAGVHRLVYTSSPSVVLHHGDLDGIDESMPYPAQHAAPYAATKAEAEKLVRAANDDKLATVSLRPHLIWGPGDNHIVPRIVARGRLRKLWRIGWGKRLIDATYVDNAADAHVLAGDRIAPGSPIAGKVYFIGNDEPVDVWELVDAFLTAADVPPVPRWKKTPRFVAHAISCVLEARHRLFKLPGEPKMTRYVVEQLSTSHWFDLSAAKRDLGYNPKVPTAEGLKRLRAWLREHPIR